MAAGWLSANITRYRSGRSLPDICICISAITIRQRRSRRTYIFTTPSPQVTDNGQFILDADFGLIKDPAALNQQLLQIPGIVETGLFINMAAKAYFGEKDGSVSSRS